jgi:hypothetical protein
MPSIDGPPGLVIALSAARFSRKPNKEAAIISHYPRFGRARFTSLLATVLLAVGCRDFVGPDKQGTTVATSALSATPPGVSGTGTIGPGTPLPGSNRQEFVFDVTAPVGGRLVYVDWGVRIAGRMIVDPVTHPGTGVTSFERISARCARVSGTGWIDTGHFWQFFIEVCDNATPGAGFDTFAITLPDRVAPGVPYARSGTLSGGDIVLRGDS